MKSIYKFCYSSFLYNSIQSYKDKVLTVDTRDADVFVTHALSGAINLSNDQIVEYLEKKNSSNIEDITLSELGEMMTQKELDKFNARKRLYCVIIVSEECFPEEFISTVKKLGGSDDHADYFEASKRDLQDDFEKAINNMEEKSAIKTGLKIYNLMYEDKVRELYILLDGANSFFEQYPFMDPSFHPSPFNFIRSHSLAITKLDITFNFPNDIYENRLFLGSYNQASQEIIVKALQVTHILNVTAECNNCHESKGIKYLHIVILDEADVSVSKFFKEAYDFIEKALEGNENNKVLLHCALGKSRSATIATMFFMKKFSWSADKALEYVKMKRRTVDPNYGFLKQLEEFEKCQCVF